MFSSPAMFRSSPLTSSGSRRRRTLRGARSFLSETPTSSSAKPIRALVPWESEDHQDPHEPPTGRIRSRKDRCRISLWSLPAKIEKHQDPHGPPTGRIRSRKDRCRISLPSLPAKSEKHQDPHRPPTSMIGSRKDLCRISPRSLPAKIGKIQDPPKPPLCRIKRW